LFTAKIFTSIILNYNKHVLCHDISLKGKVKVKVLPIPSSLLTRIVPPCFSTNSLQSISPSPVPVSFSVPSPENFESSLNNLSRLTESIPIPESAIETSKNFPSILVDNIIFPPICVNLIAFHL
jgi:hypothetical protein